MTQDKTYAVRWYGPFSSIEDVKNFEKKYKSLLFQLYLINGYRPRCKYDSYYCGQTQRAVNIRLTDPGHHINDLNRISAIWIGSITNVIELKRADINVVEKIITAQLQKTFGARFILNETNTLFPKYNAYVINIWHNKEGNRMKRYKKLSIPYYIPDVIGHEYESLIEAHVLFSASKISFNDLEL